MADDPRANEPDGERRFAQNVAQKAARRAEAERKGNHSVWFSIGLFGLVGWSVAIPTLLGLALGVWIDRTWPGQASWTLMLLLGGMAFGCVNAWYWIKQESRDERS